MLIVVTGCTAKRYASYNSSGAKAESTVEILSRTVRNNLAEESFYIEKGSVVINVNDETKKYLFSLKYQKPDKYLISLRSNTGIEGARIYISEDTVLINERIGKRLLTGRLKDLERLSGFPVIFLNAIFGDLVLSKDLNMREVQRVGNTLIINQSIYGRVSESVLDERIGKVVYMKLLKDSYQNELTLTYSKFKKSLKSIPEIVEIKELNRNIEAKIKIEKIQVPWTGIIEFIPGKGYSREEIR